jgi:hypothetical protein
MTWPPRNYRRFEISQPFFCVHGVDVASSEVQKVQDITSFLLRHRVDVASMRVQNVEISHPFI